MDGDRINMLYFNNFNANEIDTLLFASYNKNSNFSTRVDSFFVYDNNTVTMTSRAISLPRNMDIQYDWEIKLISTQAIYTVTNFTIKKEVCNACIFGNDYYNKLDRYKVNGTAWADNVVTIRK